MVSEGSPYLARSLSGLVMSCSVTALSPWPMAFSTRLAACDIDILIAVIWVCFPLCVVEEKCLRGVNDRDGLCIGSRQR